MEIVQSISRSLIYDSYFSLYRPIHPGGNVRGEMSGGIVQIPPLGEVKNTKVATHLLNFINSFIQAISIVPLQVNYYSETLPT